MATKIIYQIGSVGEPRLPEWRIESMTHEPVPFKTRLLHTIALLEHETRLGMEDWTPTIELLKGVLAEEEAKDNTNEEVDVEDQVEDFGDWEDDEYYSGTGERYGDESYERYLNNGHF